MLIEQFSYFTFSCLQCPLKDIVKTLSADLLENDKQKLSYKPFMFDLYDNRMSLFNLFLMNLRL